MKSLKLFSIIILFISCGSNSTVEKNNAEEHKPQPVLYNIRSLINNSPEEIKAKFGKPTKIINKVTDCGMLTVACQLELQFKNEQIVVEFYDNKAVYFEFNNLSEIPFTDHMYEVLGLEQSEPHYLKGNDVCWFQKYIGIHNVSFVENKVIRGYVGYITVNVIK